MTWLKPFRSQWSIGHRPNVTILVCLVQQLPPIASSSRCPVLVYPGFISMCSWCPTGFKYRDCFGIHVLSIRSVWPNHFYFLLFSWVDMGSCSVLFQSSSLLIRSDQLIFNILRKHLFMKTWTLLIIFSVSFHVSDEYINIVFLVFFLLLHVIDLAPAIL